MSKNLKQSTKTLSASNNPEDNVVALATVGGNLSNNGNAILKTIGENLVTESVALNDKVVKQKAAYAAAEASTKEMDTENGIACSLFDKAGVKTMELIEDDPAAWKEIGFQLTSDKAEDQKIPDKVTNGSISQGKFAKQCDLNFKPIANADSYTVEFTVGVLSDESVYQPVKNPRKVFPSSKISFIVPDECLGKPLWVRVMAHNTAGDSPDSDPFGGIKIQ